MARTRFEWDPAKDRENQKKDGVAFELAQYAFTDPDRVIAVDLSHSQDEQRYLCFGRIGAGILTVRFTHRGNVIPRIANHRYNWVGRDRRARPTGVRPAE
jgi:hypothetical protein